MGFFSSNRDIPGQDLDCLVRVAGRRVVEPPGAASGEFGSQHVHTSTFSLKPMGWNWKDPRRALRKNKITCKIQTCEMSKRLQPPLEKRKGYMIGKVCQYCSVQAGGQVCAYDRTNSITGHWASSSMRSGAARERWDVFVLDAGASRKPQVSGAMPCRVLGSPCPARHRDTAPPRGAGAASPPLLAWRAPPPGRDRCSSVRGLCGCSRLHPCRAAPRKPGWAARGAREHETSGTGTEKGALMRQSQ